MPTTPKRKKVKKPSFAKMQRQVVEYIRQLQDELEALKTNPESVAGQVIPQLREAITQNKRLSVLAASLIESAGGSITVSKKLLTSFESQVLSIKWEVPEGVESLEAATEFIFKYEAKGITAPTLEETEDVQEIAQAESLIEETVESGE